MPKRTDLQSILILGSGPIVIGQAAEFDYSGTQAVRTLREEGYRVILVNSNPATIMTDPDLADATCIEPIAPNWQRLSGRCAGWRPTALGIRHSARALSTPADRDLSPEGDPPAGVDRDLPSPRRVSSALRRTRRSGASAGRRGRRRVS